LTEKSYLKNITSDKLKKKKILHLAIQTCPKGFASWLLLRNDVVELATNTRGIKNVIIDISEINIPFHERYFFSGAMHSIRTAILLKKRRFVILASTKYYKDMNFHGIIYHHLYARYTLPDALNFLNMNHMQKLDKHTYEVQTMPSYAEIKFHIGRTYPVVFPMEALKKDIKALVSEKIKNIIICTDFKSGGESARSEIYNDVLAWFYKEVPELLDMKLPRGVAIRFADHTLNSMKYWAEKEDWPIDNDADDAKDALLKKWKCKK